MSEPSTVVPAQKPGAKTAGAANAPVAGNAVSSVPVDSAAGKSVPLFGGHRGGGKKRADGLPAGSPEALEADRKKDRDRKNAANAAKRVAALPPALPAALAPLQNAAAPLADGAAPVPGVVAGVAGAAAAAPLFIPWSQKLLEKPAKLLTKIIDRCRCWTLMKKVRQCGLTPEQEKEIAADLKWKDEVVADFNLALAECAVQELNKRRVPGAQNSHWVNLAMCGGEMAMAHMQALDRLEKMLLAKKGHETENAKALEAAVKN
jgi:hypothetical protein